ncbi:hypothetical protein HYPSUDRAFT_46121 [Hypholoma sublateritium FD-334 SS-4]|uniref:Zinc-finger domain-containing protein n=1 Tax=Hypholoma sublateritium (strain FD-334 SS-4) TaxID=945553 RepID=A0A0D2KSM2_HYPSF|nr:hypothetical protein HYPSUDRAFT_46121 [Hypholoma sublateritium FD-334 SS-4]
MACKCGKFFCARCLVTRYQERTFDLTKRQPNCPYCDQTCNCSICCVKQGKKYVSQRGKNTMRPASKRAGPLGRTTAMHIFSPLLPPSAFVRPPQATQYWGTVYSVDRGRKLGAAFTQPGADGLPPVVYASAVAQSTRPRPRPEKPARVFVGKVQRAWGFGRHPYVVNIPPPALSPSRSVKRRRGVVSMPGRVRCIVGNADVLRYPVRTYNDDLLAGLSPLTSIDDSDEDSNGNGTVGEQPLAAAAAAVSEEVFVPGSLEERDVARAIAASFRALGIAFIVEDIPSY